MSLGGWSRVPFAQRGQNRQMAQRPESCRPLREDERALLDHLLMVEMPGIDELRAQIDLAEVIEDRTAIWHVGLWVPDEAPPAKAVLDQSPIRAITNPDVPGGGADVSLWMDGYYLGAIEIAWWNRNPERLPRPDELQPAFRDVITPPARAVDHAARYQILDHATDESPLWDIKFGITILTTDGRRIKRHSKREPEELRPELKRLLHEGHIQLYEMTAPDNRLLTMEEALAVIKEDVNWYSPHDLGEDEKRETIYSLTLTDTGHRQFRDERSRADAS
jgi:hypothetical protein